MGTSNRASFHFKYEMFYDIMYMNLFSPVFINVSWSRLLEKELFKKKFQSKVVFFNLWTRQTLTNPHMTTQF